MISFYTDSSSAASSKRLQELLCTSDPLTSQQKHDIYHKCPVLLTAVTSIMVRAIEAGHKSENINSHQFWNDLFLSNSCEGYVDNKYVKHINRPLMSMDAKANLAPSSIPIPDPYAKLDFQACMKYVFFNCGRRRECNGKLEPFTDHESFYRFFGLMPITTYAPQKDKNGNSTSTMQLRCGEFSKALHRLTSHRNVLMHNSQENRESVTLPEYGAAIADLHLILEPLCNTVWHKQNEAIDLANWLDIDFYSAAGDVTYPVSALMAHCGIPKHQQATMESLLTDANVPVDEGKATIRVNPERFALAMRYAWMHATHDWDRAVSVIRESASVPVKPNPNDHQPDVFACPTPMRSLPLKELKRMVNSGNADAQVELGCRYWLGVGDIEQNYDQAFASFTKAAQMDRNNGDAQFYLGQCWETGHCPDNPARLSKAISCFRKASRAGQVQAMVKMGCYYEEQGHPDQAFALYDEASRSGDPNALYHLGRCYEEGIHCERNLEEAIMLYREAVDGGLKKAKLSLAKCLRDRETGFLTKEAEELLQQLVDDGDARAMCELADEYSGIWEDLYKRAAYMTHDSQDRKTAEEYRSKAEQLYRRAIDGGYTRAWLHLGDHLSPVEESCFFSAPLKEYREALECYRKAGEAGHAEGYYNIGWVLSHNRGLHRMPNGETMGYFRKAADMGHVQSMFLVALHDLEHGVQNDGDEPLYYRMADAASMGHDRAKLLTQVFEDHYPGQWAADWSGFIAALQQGNLSWATEWYALAYCYLQRAQYGNSSVGDTKAALHYLEMAAREGSKLAMCELYEQTREDDPAGAMAWLQTAAQEGSYLAMRKMYRATCDSDPDGAAAWLRKAADAGDYGSVVALECLQQGREVRFHRDYDDSVSLDVTDEERAFLEEMDEEED